MNLESIQIILITALVIGTVLMTVIGIQLIIILRETRQMINRANNVAAGAQKIGSFLERSTNSVQGFIEGMGVVSKLVQTFTKKKEGK